jgi:metallo-beta-lactamase class B
MRLPRAILATLFVAVPMAGDRVALQADPPKKCESCEEWNVPHEPYRVFGNTYYVGMGGVSSVLIASDQGLILLDGALSQSAPLIDASIRKLGFRTEDVKLIVNSHAHYDHTGGIAALQRVSGATVAASASGARAIEQGECTTDDPQYGFGREANSFPPVKKVRVVKDGETLHVGPLALTAHLTPGHTPGSTTWTWRSCEGQRCLDIVYADSLNSISAPGFRFSGDAKHPSLVESFRASIAKVAALPCDILLSVHPVASDMEARWQRGKTGGTNALVDPQGCRVYAEGAAQRLEQRVAEENRTAAPGTPR